MSSRVPDCLTIGLPQRAKKYLGGYLAILGGADAMVFGEGIGEHALDIRSRICKSMEWCGLWLDSSANAQLHSFSPSTIVPIHADASGLEILVGGTDEEALIAREKYRLLDNPLWEEGNRLHDAQSAG